MDGILLIKIDDIFYIYIAALLGIDPRQRNNFIQYCFFPSTHSVVECKWENDDARTGSAKHRMTAFPLDSRDPLADPGKVREEFTRVCYRRARATVAGKSFVAKQIFNIFYWTMANTAAWQ